MIRLGGRRFGRLGSAVGIAGILALSMGTTTGHAIPVAPSQSTTTTLSSSAGATNASTYGTTVTLSATVFPTSLASPPQPTSAPSGSVRFWDGGTNLGTVAVTAAGGNATASLATNALPVGSHSLTAVYLGNAVSTGSQSTPAIVHVVSKASTSTTASSSKNPSTLGDLVTFTAVVAGAGGLFPTGTVTFSDGSTVVAAGTLDAAGTTTFSSAMALGSHSITAAYQGDANFSPSAAPAVVQVVRAASVTVLTSAPNPSTWGDSVALTATVSGTNGVPTGTVVFSDGGATIGTTTLDSTGTATVNVSTLAAGATPHSLTATYSGDPIGYTGSASAPATDQVVNPATSGVTLSATPSSSKFGNSVSLLATVTPADATGTVSFMEGLVTLGSAPLSAGSAAMSTSALSVGSHDITASFASGDTNHTSGTSTFVTVTVARADTTTVLTATPNPVISGNMLSLSAAVGSARTGTVAFSANGTPLGTGTVTSGTASLNTSALTAGSYTITATYSGDANYAPGTAATADVTVLDLTSTAISSSSNNAAYGTGITFTATVTGATLTSPAPGGTVSFMDGPTLLGTGTLNGSSVATFSTASLAGGSHNVTAVYGGDLAYHGSTSSVLVQTVTLKSTTTGLAASPSTVEHGQGVSLSATVTSGATGTVTFWDFNGTTNTPIGTAAISGGTAAMTTSSLTTGSHQIGAVYSGDGNFSGSSASPSVTVNVNRTTTALRLVALPNPATLGQDVTLTATVSGSVAPSGTVDFWEGTTNLATVTLDSSGKAVFTVVQPAAGTHALTATYSGDGDNVGSLGNTSLTVNLRSSATSLSSNHNPSTPGQSVTITAAVTPGATGTVTFRDGSTTIGSGTLSAGAATLTTSGLSVGSHSLTAAYGGDAGYSPSTSSPLAQVVGTLTTTVLGSSPNASASGQAVVFTATVSPGSATGMVTFTEGTTQIGTGTLGGSGVATLSISTLTAGTHPITATYAGSASHAGSTSNTVSQVVNGPTATTTALTSSLNPSTAGQSVTLQATVTAGATGSVAFKDGTTVLGTVALTGTTATTTVSTLAAGSHPITAVYNGSAGYSTSTSNTVTQVVVAPPADAVTVNLSSHAMRADGTSHDTATATVRDSLGAARPGVLVTWTSSATGAAATGGVTFASGTTSTTDLNGVATIVVSASTHANAPATRTTITATEANGTGSDQVKLTGSKFKAALKLTPASVPVNGQSTAVANVVDGSGAPVQGERVDFANDGSAGSPTFATAFATTDANGDATTTLTAGNTGGTRTVTASDAASDVTASNFAQTSVLTQIGQSNASFIHAAFQTMLGHDTDAAGLANWLNQFNSGTPRSALATYLASTPDYRTKVISGSGTALSDFYNLYLDRNGDAGGIAYWVGRMAGSGGLTFEQVRLRFAGSPEYFSSLLVGSNDRATAIRALYTDLLGRTDGGASDTAGTAYWMSHYDATVIAGQFLYSPEGRAFLVNAVYQQILNRGAEPGGLSYWTNALLSGASDENIIASILSSDEYFLSH